MSQELHYTSVPRGLKPGSRGFCTVGLTPHMPGPLVDRLEALSGYQPVFPPHDPSAPLNPIVFSHLRLTISGKSLSVLSRIGPAGLDYSGRPNKYAHHIVLEGAERAEGGPAWLLSQPGFIQGAWEGEPREIPAGRTPPQGDRPPGVGHAWQSLIGDGGWAGVLAETFLADPRRTVFLVFRPGMDLLPLFAEAQALLPPSRRWDVDFSTYFSPLPQGTACVWRGVLDGSEEAKNAQRLPNAVFFDLCHLLGRAEGGTMVHIARTGERSAHEPGTANVPPESGRRIPRVPQEHAVAARDLVGDTEGPRPWSASESYDLVPELARLASVKEPSTPFEDRDRNWHRRRRSWTIFAVIIAACLAPPIILGYLFRTGSAITLLGSNPGLTQEIAAERVKVTEAKNRENAEKASEASRLELERLSDIQKIAAKVKPDDKPRVPPPESDAPSNQTTTQPDVRPEALAGKDEPKDANVVFFKLPPTERSGLGGGSTEKAAQKQLKNMKVIAYAKLLNSPDFKVDGDLKSGWQIEPRTSGVLGKSPVARLRVKDNEILFEWLDAGKQAISSTAVRDSVLKVAGADGSECDVLLRDPEISDHNAFDLTNTPDKAGHRPLVRDDYKHRGLPVQWAVPDDIVGTKWVLGIRRWKIVSHSSQFPEAVMAEGDRTEPPAKIEQDIIPGEAALRIEIEPERPHLFQVFIEFYKDAMRRRVERQEFLAKYHGDERELAELRKGPRGSQSVEQKIQKIEKRILENMSRMKECEQNENKDRHLLRSERAELSIVVSLRVDGSTFIDIAKFGEFAVPSH